MSTATINQTPSGGFGYDFGSSFGEGAIATGPGTAELDRVPPATAFLTYAPGTATLTGATVAIAVLIPVDETVELQLV